MKVREL